MIELRNISKTYSKKNRKVKAIDDINVSFGDTGLIGIIGPSGCGKSTLLNVVYGNVLPTNGNVYYNGELIDSKIRRKFTYECSYVFQDYNLVSSMTIYDNINLSLKLHNLNKNKDEVEECLCDLGLPHEVMESFPDELSGGQQQRVAIARAILTESKIILADEPTGALDDDTADSVISLLKDISKNKLVIVVSHNKNLISKYVDRLIEINDGKIINDTEINNLLESNFEKRTTYKKTGFLEFIKLGFKYVNAKTFKFYLSLVLMSITFTLLLLSIAFITFNSDKSYENTDKSICNYTLFNQFIDEENDLFERYLFDQINTTFTTEELDSISNINNNYLKIYKINMGFVFGNKTCSVHGGALINDAFYKLDYKLVGKMPEYGEALITKAQLDYVGATDYTEIKYVSGLKVSGYVEFEENKGTKDTFDLNNLIYFNTDKYEGKFMPVCLLYQKLSLDEMNDLSTKVSYHGRVTFESYLLDSYRRVGDFSNEMMAFGIPACVILILLSLLLLVNYVYSTIDANINDVKIIKMIGGSTRELSLIYVVQPTIMVMISLMFAFAGYFVAKYYIDMFIYSHLSLASTLLVLSFVDIVISLLVISIFIILSVMIPVAKLNVKK